MARRKYRINIKLIIEENEKFIENQIKMIKDENLTYFQKRLKVLGQLKTTTFYKENNNDKPKDNNDNIVLFNESDEQNSNYNQSDSYIGDPNSTYDNSKSNENYKFDENENLLTQFKEKKFNSLRANFYLKHKLYDILFIKNSNYPPKYIINEKYYSFVYPNEIISYSFVRSGFFEEENPKKDLTIINYNDTKYLDKYGLYFCTKNIEVKIGNDIYNKKCSPNEFICKKCMEINKKHYNLKKNYFINIYGRVSKINKESFHCFGHFLIGNQIEDCISKFSCKGCKFLDFFSKYYL